MAHARKAQSCSCAIAHSFISRSLRRSMDRDCISCARAYAKGECFGSLRRCGHHCNHSWSSGYCCWCGTTFGNQPALVPSTPPEDSDGDALARPLNDSVLWDDIERRRKLLDRQPVLV